MGANGSQLLPYLGTQLARQPLAALPLLAMLFSSVASLQTGVLPNARGALAMGRDRTLGRVWTRVSPKYGTPAAGSLLIAGIAAAIAILGIGIGTLNQFVLAMATSVGHPRLRVLRPGRAGLRLALPRRAAGRRRAPRSPRSCCPLISARPADRARRVPGGQRLAVGARASPSAR